MRQCRSAGSTVIPSPTVQGRCNVVQGIPLFEHLYLRQYSIKGMAVSGEVLNICLTKEWMPHRITFVYRAGCCQRQLYEATRPGSVALPE